MTFAHRFANRCVAAMAAACLTTVAAVLAGWLYFSAGVMAESLSAFAGVFLIAALLGFAFAALSRPLRPGRALGLAALVVLVCAVFRRFDQNVISIQSPLFATVSVVSELILWAGLVGIAISTAVLTYRAILRQVSP